jgi:hypothetical protein
MLLGIVVVLSAVVTGGLFEVGDTGRASPIVTSEVHMRSGGPGTTEAVVVRHETGEILDTDRLEVSLRAATRIETSGIGVTTSTVHLRCCTSGYFQSQVGPQFASAQSLLVDRSALIAANPGRLSSDSYLNLTGTHVDFVWYSRDDRKSHVLADGDVTASNAPPTARFSNGVAVQNQPVFLSSSPATDDGQIIDAEWDFGADGTYDQDSDTVSRTYTSPGPHLVKLRVWDDDGRTSTTTRTIHVYEPPNANIDVAPATPAPGAAVTLDGGSSVDPDGSIATYEWDFHDDGSVDATGSTATTSFPSPGTYDVRLTVTDTQGGTDSTVTTITVSP